MGIEEELTKAPFQQGQDRLAATTRQVQSDINALARKLQEQSSLLNQTLNATAAECLAAEEEILQVKDRVAHGTTDLRLARTNWLVQGWSPSTVVAD